jgi:hypothetical protein
MSDFNEYLNWLWALICIPFIMAYNIGTSMISKLDNAHKRISEHELHVAQNYIHIKNFEKMETRIFQKLDQIEMKIDGKKDKNG